MIDFAVGARVRIVLGEHFGKEGEVLRIDGDRVFVRSDAGGRRAFVRSALLVISGGTPPTALDSAPEDGFGDRPLNGAAANSGGSPPTVRIEAGGRLIYPAAPSDPLPAGGAIAPSLVLDGGGTSTTNSPHFSGGTPPTLIDRGLGEDFGDRLSNGGGLPPTDCDRADLRSLRTSVLLEWLDELESKGTLDAWIETERRSGKTLYRVVYHAHLAREPRRISAKDAVKLKSDIERGRWARQIRALLKCPELS